MNAASLSNDRQGSCATSAAAIVRDHPNDEPDGYHIGCGAKFGWKGLPVFGSVFYAV
ncbi:MAG: hypothetical protein JWN85_1652 [Gammaproteobacteria bacterium]|nr:hypothetical protein [Gammaproteobacteria bacterium]